MRSELVAAFAIAVCSAPAFAQVVVKSPEVPVQKEQELVSPAVLEFPIPEVLLSLARGNPAGKARVPVPMPDFGRYVCSNVKIKSLSLFAETPNKKGLIRLEGRVVLTTSAGGDRLVHFELAIVAREKTLASDLVRKIDAEERKTASKKLSLDVAASDLAAEPPPTFRITLDVLDNT